MALRPQCIVAMLALVLATALLAALASAPAAEARGVACKRFGDRPPAALKTDQARRAVRCLVNRTRARSGLRPLARNKRLQRAAQRHSKRMRASRCFAHRCPGQAGLGRRLKRVGYLTGGLRSWMYAENIAWGTGGRGTPRAIVARWMRSPGHRANILHRQLRDLGVGVTKGSPTGRRANAGIYTVDFGFRAR